MLLYTSVKLSVFQQKAIDMLLAKKNHASGASTPTTHERVDEDWVVTSNGASLTALPPGFNPSHRGSAPEVRADDQRGFEENVCYEPGTDEDKICKS